MNKKLKISQNYFTAFDENTKPVITKAIVSNYEGILMFPSSSLHYQRLNLQLPELLMAIKGLANYQWVTVLEIVRMLIQVVNNI
jgi:hypothetical protein